MDPAKVSCRAHKTFVSQSADRGDLMRMTASNALNNVVTAITGLTIARLISPTDFGSYSASLNIMMVLATLADLGVGVALVRFANSSEDEHATRGVVQDATRLKLTSTAFLFLLSVPLGWLIARFVLASASATPLLVLAVCGAAALNLWTLVRSIFQSKQDYRGYAGITSRYALVRLALLGPALLVGVRTPEIVLSLLYIAAPLMIAPITLVRIVLDGAKGNAGASRDQLLKYGRPLLASGLLYPLAYSFPQFILLRSGDGHAAGVLGIALLFAGAMQPFNDALRAYFIPKVSSIQTVAEARAHVSRVIKKTPLCILAGFVAVLFVSVIYHYFLEQKYPDGLLAIIILLSASILGMLGGAVNSLIHYLGVPGLDALSNVLRLAVVVSLGLFLIPRMAAVGGAIATLGGVVVGEIFTFVALSIRLQARAARTGEESK